MKQPRFKRGFTLAEVLLAVVFLTVALCTLLAAFMSCSVLMVTSKNVNIATNTAFGLIEQMRSSPFSELSDPVATGLEINNTAFMQIDTHLYKCNFSVNVLPPNMAVVYIDDSDPDLLQITVSVSWRQGKRVIGEDKNLNGILDAGEDANGNGGMILDSPVELVTLIANR